MAKIRFDALRAIGLCLAATACADSSQRFLHTESPTSPYLLINVGLSTTSTQGPPAASQSTLPIYYRLFERDQKLAICGYYLVVPTSCERDLKRQLLDNSEVLVNDKPIGSGQFFTPVASITKFDLASRRMSYEPQTAPEARCVLTDIPWDESLARAPRLALRGGRAYVTCPIF